MRLLPGKHTEGFATDIKDRKQTKSLHEAAIKQFRWEFLLFETEKERNGIVTSDKVHEFTLVSGDVSEQRSKVQGALHDLYRWQKACLEDAHKYIKQSRKAGGDQVKALLKELDDPSKRLKALCKNVNQEISETKRKSYHTLSAEASSCRKSVYANVHLTGGRDRAVQTSVFSGVSLDLWAKIAPTSP